MRDEENDRPAWGKRDPLEVEAMAMQTVVSGGYVPTDVEKLRAALLTVLDQVDYTAGNCSLTELVGACLPREVIFLARKAFAIEPEHVPADPLESTLAQQLADWIESGGRERLIALIDFCVDEHRLYERDDPLKTFQQWITGGTGPRDFDWDRFDAQR